MDINNINSSGVNSLSALVNAALDGQSVTPRMTSTSLLGGDSVTVSASSNTTDVEKLAALLLQEANEAREDSLLSRMKALSEHGIFEARCEEANGEAKDKLSELDKASNEAGRLEKALGEANTAKSDAEADLRTAEAAKRAAEQALNRLSPNASKKEKDAAKKAVEDAKEDVTIASNALKDANDNVTDLTNKLNDQNAKVSELAAGLDMESYRLLLETLNLHSEISEHHLNPLEDKSDEEEVAQGGNVPQSERSPLDIIRDALRRSNGEFLNTLETRRENIV